MYDNRHPLARQLDPEQPGWYEMRGYPQDDWTRMRWDGEAFRYGMRAAMWYQWRPVQELEASE